MMLRYFNPAIEVSKQIQMNKFRDCVLPNLNMNRRSIQGWNKLETPLQNHYKQNNDRI